MRRYPGWLVCLALVLSGCRTGERAHRMRAPDWESPEMSVARAQKVPPVVRPTNSAKPIISASLATNQPRSGWISLERWCGENHYAPPVQTPSTPAQCVVHTSAGSFAFRAGSTSGFWNGSEIRLGFAPQINQGEMMMNWLDIQKTLEPLISNAQLSAPAAAPVAVIDPGHGGSDPGAHAADRGHFEKEFTLDWARRLAPILVAKGWQVFSTRTNDCDLPLAARVAFADAHRADLFVSLHFNSSAEGRQQGIETYCLTPCGMRSAMNRGYDDDASSSYPNNAFDTLNITLAQRVHAALLRDSGSNDRGVRRARFPTVLKNQTRPAILVEGGYISSPEEAEKIGNAEYRQKLAEAVAAAMVASVKLPSNHAAELLEAAGPESGPKTSAAP